jgi:hypothetical protein
MQPYNPSASLQLHCNWLIGWSGYLFSERAIEGGRKGKSDRQTEREREREREREILGALTEKN